MLRSMTAAALAGALLLAPSAPAADSQPNPVEKQLAVQSAMLNGRKCLDANMPAEAVAALEQEISHADGNKAFLALLREAYSAELGRLEKSPDADPERLRQTQRRLALLRVDPKTAPAAPVVAPAVPVVAPVVPPVPVAGAALPPFANPVAEPNLGPSLVTPVAEPSVVPAAAPVAAPATDVTADAVAAFKKGNYADADRLFGALGGARLTADQKTAWAYCRIKLAADRVNAPGCDAHTAAVAVQDVSAALGLIPQNPELQKVGQQVLKAAQSKAGDAKVIAPVAAVGETLETANFRVHHGGNREAGDAVAKAAEEGRKQIFERWSGPPSGAWQVKCDIVIHADAEAYTRATGKPAALTGHASVSLTNGRATARRVDLRADDSAMVANALPRELTHVVLADLFSNRPPPKWALEGMAVLAGSPEEVGRYVRTLPRCARDNELRPLASLFELKDVPADKITGFYCQSVSVTEYLIKLKGERSFKIFLSDAERYGLARALQRQYEIDSPQALEAAWKRANFTP